jgi:hypothetical protein
LFGWKEKKNKPRIFLGKIAVDSGNDIKRFIETIVWVPESNLDTELHRQLSEIFSFPKISSESIFQKNDLCIDVFLSSFHTGGGISIDWLPIFWRPRLTLLARLHNVRSGKILGIVKVTENSSWREFYSRSIEWRRLLNISENFDKNDMMVLVSRASPRLLRKVADLAYKHS